MNLYYLEANYIKEYNLVDIREMHRLQHTIKHKYGATTVLKQEK